mgnify:FL=1
MANPVGFLEYNRELPPDFEAEERILHWMEFHQTPDIEQIQHQASRCMDCGTPFCHSGKIISRMTMGCPLHNLIPEWNDLVYRGLYKKALERLLKTNNFPEFTGRVCPAPCEGSCTLGLNYSPVTIKSIEQMIVEKGFEEGLIYPQPPAFRTEKKVAVVGSGPSGLACADLLNRAGHNVTVFERDDRVGGLLVYGIPNMKLGKQIVQRRINLLIEEGITFITRTEIGKDYPAHQLRDDFDAVVLCGGATNPRDIEVEGRTLKGIHFAMDYLKANTRNLLGGIVHDADVAIISARNKDVLVIGGGDTGTDCVGTCLRHACRSVTQLEILPVPPKERARTNPWPEWPKVFKTDYGQEEACSYFGRDPREFGILTKRFVGDENGAVKEVHTVQVDWINDNGKMSPREIPGTERVWPAQLVLLAMGFSGPEDLLPDQFGVSRDSCSNVKTIDGHYATNVRGIFAAGDMRRGQSLVVWAINEGRDVAQEVDRYLMGEV